MGLFIKFVDASLILFFIFVATGTFFFNAHICLPHLLPFFPTFIEDLMDWFLPEFGGYLAVDKPKFFVGAMWIELLLQWPLSFVCLYGIVTGKSWLPTTCLIYGVSCATSTAISLADILSSDKASEKMLKMYLSFFGFGVLAALRGLVPYSGKTNGVGKSSALNRKKRA